MEMTITSPLDLQRADFSNQTACHGTFSPVTTVAGMLIGLFAGPGLGVTSPWDLPAAREPVSHARAKEGAAALVVAPAAELITRIKEGWQFNMTEVAEILGVTRPTVYSWFNGKTSPDADKIQRLQILAAAASIWAEQTQGKNWDYIIDYTGPRADELSVRDHLKSGATTTDQLRELIPTRIAQFQQAYAESRKLLGDPPPLPKTAPPESARRMNALWAKNAKKLHASRNRNR